MPRNLEFVVAVPDPPVHVCHSQERGNSNHFASEPNHHHFVRCLADTLAYSTHTHQSQVDQVDKDVTKTLI